MIQVKIKKITYKNHPSIGTKKEFEDGKKEYTITARFEVATPHNYNPMQKSDNDFFVERDCSLQRLTKIGYHVGDEKIILENTYSLENEYSEFPKIYMAE